MSQHRFPNFFMLLGPNSGLGHNSVIIMIEAQVNYVTDLVKRLAKRLTDLHPPHEAALLRRAARSAAELEPARALLGEIESAAAALEFEKDDASNGHVAFIAAASNARAACYGIAAADELETKRIAGRVVPAIATTTAIVAGLACVELLKLAAARGDAAALRALLALHKLVILQDEVVHPRFERADTRPRRSEKKGFRCGIHHYCLIGFAGKASLAICHKVSHS